MSVRILCLGEPLAKITQGETGFSLGFGGDTLLTAIHCARSRGAADITVDYVTAVGTDPLSQGLVDLLKAEGIGTAHITRDPDRPIGIGTAAAGGPAWRDTSAARAMCGPGTPHLAALAGADLIFLSGSSLAILSPEARDRLWQALADARATGSRIAFASHYRPQHWPDAATARDQIARFWQVTDIALPALTDEAALCGSDDPATIIARLRQAGVTTGALHRETGGPLSLDPAAPPQECPAADHGGDGDSFNGGYLAAIAAGLPPEQALARAHDPARRTIGPLIPDHGARPPKTAARRMASVIRLRPEHLAEYTRLHAEVWPGVLARLRASHVTNYSIYLRQPEMLMFGYFEYTGSDFAADDAAIAADPVTQDWWALCGPMQDPFDTRAPGEWWAGMTEVFHLD